ncbi:MAG: phosphotriesterase [Anaerolineales bacterium]
MIRTVCGDIDQSQLGICQMHEHLLGAPPPPYAAQDPDLVLDSIPAAIREMGFFKQAGGRAIVEMTPIDYNRDPAGLRQVSEQTGIHIIGITGFLKNKFCAPFVAARTVDELAAWFIRDIVQGIPQTGVQAGVIKAASSKNEITPAEEKVFQAAAQACLATGALISTHTEAGTMALEQIDLLTAAGVPPQRILIGHLDRKLDWDYHLAIARRGVWLGYDHIGKEKYYPDHQRIDFIQRLVAEGFAGQLLFSCDLARRSYMPSYNTGGGPGFTYLLWRFVPWLRQAGCDETTLQTILILNPAQALDLKGA